MRYFSPIATLALVFAVLLGTAFKCGDQRDEQKPAANNSRATPQTGPSSSGLKLGEYACYGNGGLLIGLGFKVLSGGRYTDLDGKGSGSFSISGDTVEFDGGHLDGQVGRNLHDYKFSIKQADCEPFS
ncbi:MAG: hypothetical protein JO053_01575 [Acidobacteria bacterium]|nr:hypothetical protein [Acidobacteriota bacterium]